MGVATTLATKTFAKHQLRVVAKDGVIHGMIDGKVVLQGTDAGEVMKNLETEASRLNPQYFGFDGARNRFLHWFAGGFDSPNYRKDERDYKLDAKKRLDEHAPLAEAATGSGFGPAVLSAYRTNLLSQYELMRLSDALHGPKADDFVRGAARFALGDLKDGLSQMQKALKPHNVARWTAVTYLPFLWRPDAHMFLKPEVTKDFAFRVGHPFASEYESDLDVRVYERLLDLAGKTETEIADLHPQDRIDVQGFIFVVGSYQDGRETPKP